MHGEKVSPRGVILVLGTVQGSTLYGQLRSHLMRHRPPARLRDEDRIRVLAKSVASGVRGSGSA